LIFCYRCSYSLSFVSVEWVAQFYTNRMRKQECYVIYHRMKPKHKVVAGETYGKLTAISFANKTKDGKHRWLFQCDCGQRTIAIAGQVFSGRTKSCGCLKTFVLKKRNNKRKFFPVIGKVYGHLTAIEDAHEKTKDYRGLWWFQCDCGNRIKTAASLVAYGTKTSCGCRAISMVKGRAPFAPLDDVAVRMPKRIWAKTYSDGCSLELFMKLSQEPCHYCGEPPSNKFTRKYSSGVETFIYSGLDRKDPARDHSPDNIVPCCYSCNIAKCDMTYDEFLAWNARVYLHTTRVKTLNDLP
jgi:hypothetical protein